MKLVLEKAYNQYGAFMGRPNSLPDNRNAKARLQLQRLRFVDGDYDVGGAYWGGGSCTYIYCAFGDIEEVNARVFVRAVSRAEAKQLVRYKLPNVTFYN